MADYTIREDGTAFSIELTDIQGKQKQLLQAFGECQLGKCSCPADQYEKVAAMEVKPRTDEIATSLKPIAGERFYTGEIATCLDCTIAQTEKQPGLGRIEAGPVTAVRRQLEPCRCHFPSYLGWRGPRLQRESRDTTPIDATIGGRVGG
jgi:hypothetical protein